jgi:sporulation protein YlmC with PRC-barrel domain
MKWIKTCTVLLAVASLLLVRGAFAAQDERADIYRASKVIGADVVNPQGDKLGDIKDVVFDPATGRIQYAVLGAGGFLGVGEKYFAIPWEALTSKAGDKGDFILNVDKEKLQNAPSFDKNNWPNMADRNWAQQVYAYYGVTPHWERTATRSAASTGAQGMAGGPTITATVKNIDQSANRLTMQTADDQTIEMQAPAALLNQLQAGDRVEVAIHKQETAAPQSK